MTLSLLALILHFHVLSWIKTIKGLIAFLNCDRILENLPFGHRHWLVWYNYPYLLGKTSFWCETSHQECLIVALSNCEKNWFNKNCQDFQLTFLKSLLVPKRRSGHNCQVWLYNHNFRSVLHLAIVGSKWTTC